MEAKLKADNKRQDLEKKQRLEKLSDEIDQNRKAKSTEPDILPTSSGSANTNPPQEVSETENELTDTLAMSDTLLAALDTPNTGPLEVKEMHSNQTTSTDDSEVEFNTSTPIKEQQRGIRRNRESGGGGGTVKSLAESPSQVKNTENFLLSKKHVKNLFQEKIP